MAHRLSHIDADARTAECAECGAVSIFKNGDYFTCAVAKKARMKKWAQRNPEAAKRNRASNSAHFLSWRSPERDFGFCDECQASVDLVAYGRGYACGVRVAQLRTKVETAPQARCSMCARYPQGQELFQGRCLSCAADLILQADALAGTHTSTWADYADPRPLTTHQGEYLEGFTVAGAEDDPFALDDWQPVPSWRTIGSLRPWNEV